MASRPNILAISLDFEDMVKEISVDLWSTLKSCANVVTASSAEQATELLGSLHLQAVLLTDAAVAKGTKYENVCNLLSTYVQNGGIVIMCCIFSNFIGPDEFDNWLRQRWGLNWLFSDYHRTTFYLNPAGENLSHKPGLPNSYSMKAVSLKGVEERSKIYHPTGASNTQSLVFSSQPVKDLSQAAVAYQKVGNGWLGYVGDVNSEKESTAVVMAMCGLVKGDACYVCGEITSGEEKKPLLSCSRCHKAAYCSQACQKKDWKRHKAVCRASTAG
ncbi:hypothetical protein BDD12DRAFT_855523 [Trichophaea hybrida]|nr:hypothetical protein BDD12DRAFT_855523 [Trichophaea hybrida]